MLLSLIWQPLLTEQPYLWLSGQLRGSDVTFGSLSPCLALISLSGAASRVQNHVA